MKGNMHENKLANEMFCDMGLHVFGSISKTTRQAFFELVYLLIKDRKLGIWLPNFTGVAVFAPLREVNKKTPHL